MQFDPDSDEDDHVWREDEAISQLARAIAKTLVARTHFPEHQWPELRVLLELHLVCKHRPELERLMRSAAASEDGAAGDVGGIDWKR